MPVIPINSGTGPNVAVDTVGTSNIQIVKIMQAADGNTASLATTLAISGTATVIPSGTQNVSVVNTAAVTVATGTMNVVNVLSASGVTVANITTGTLSVVNVLSASGVTVASVATITTLLGTVSVSGGGGGVQYSQGTTSIAATGTGTLAFGIQGTTAFAFSVTSSGHQIVAIPGTVTITGTVGALMLQQLDATNDTVGIFAAMSGTTARSAVVMTTSGGRLMAEVVGTAHNSRFQAFVMATTSATAGVIIRTSGAHTLYITDLLVSVSGPMSVQLCSETTAFGTVFLASNGGFAKDYRQPVICTSAQSFRVILSTSGSCAVNVVGYTVT